MKAIVGLVLLAFVAASHARSRPAITFTEKCSKEYDVPREVYDNFDPHVSHWTESGKCYARCELRDQGVLVGDNFNESFTAAVQDQFQNGDAATKPGAKVLADCMKEATAEGCEKAYQFAKCIAGPVVSAAFLREFVAKHV